MDSKEEGGKRNEEIVDELTKNLQHCCVRLENGSTAQDHNTDTDEENNGPWEDARENPNDETDSAAKTESKTDLPSDFVDEELLKDREVTLSESDKEKLKEEAESLKNEGNDLFKSGSYPEAILLYTRGLRTCPLAYSKDRSILYANRAAAKSKISEKGPAIEDCTKAIELNETYVKAYSRRAQLYEETEKLDEALEDYKKVLTFDPTHVDANYGIRRLPPLIEARNEKLKAEMLGKLKDIGNLVLKPFGLSTNNFELEKNAGSGGYSVKFKQNPN